MRLSPVHLYHQALWEYLLTYKVSIVIMRLMQLLTIVVKTILFNVPIELVSAKFIGRSSGVFHRDPFTINSTVRYVFEELGPTWVKFAQILSMRPECPPGIREDLQKIQENVKPFSFKEVQNILERELKQPIHEVFSHIDESPVAAASLAQVHYAKLVDGTEVALKVQRPNLVATVEIDVVIVRLLLRAIGLLPMVRKKTNLGFLGSSFSSHLREEVDFFREGRNQDKFRLMYQDHPRYSKYVKVADVYWDYTTSKLLTMEFVHNFYHVSSDKGKEIIARVRIDRPDGYEDWRPDHLAWLAGAFFGDQLLHYKFLHGDPHYSNWYVTEEGQLFFCDFGMMQTFTKDEADRVLELITCLFYWVDPERLTNLFIRIHEGDPSKVDRNALYAKSKGILERRFVRSQGDLNMPVSTINSSVGGCLETQSTELIYALVTAGLQLPDWVWLVIKSFAYINEYGVEVFPYYDITPMFGEPCKRGIRRKMMAELGTKNMSNLRESVDDLVSDIVSPELEGVVKSIAKGSISQAR